MLDKATVNKEFFDHKYSRGLHDLRRYNVTLNRFCENSINSLMDLFSGKSMESFDIQPNTLIRNKTWHFST